jgi:hypothetical protein
MSAIAGRPKPLMQWMDEGDPDLVPVLMADGRSTAASYFGMHRRPEDAPDSFTAVAHSPVTPELTVQCSLQTGIHVLGPLGYPTPFDVIEFLEDIEREERVEQCAGGTRRFTNIRTPQGELSEVFFTPLGRPAAWEEHLVKGEGDLPAWICFIEAAAEAAEREERVAHKVTAALRQEARRWPQHVPLYATVGVAAFELMSSLYVEQSTALYLLADHTTEMERLFEAQERASAVWARCAAEAGADFILGALNGLELFSPAIYERYFVPQGRRLFDAAHTLGVRTWVHTCGRMNRLIQMRVYQAMGVDVLESLSHPPLGDVADLRVARAAIGPAIVTRGAINVSLFYEGDQQSIRQRTREVVQQTQGYRHMVGDTNDSFPPYPRESILAILDELDRLGVLFRAVAS